MSRLIQVSSPYAADSRATLLLPSGYKRDGTRTLIVAMGGIFTDYHSVAEAAPTVPGSPGIDTVWTLSGVTGLLPYIVDKGGYPILCVEAKSAASLGQTDCLTSITNAVTWARLSAAATAWPGPLNVKSSGVGFIGYSRGGLIAANWIARNLSDSAFLVSLDGAMDADDIYDNNRGSYAPFFDASYYALTGMNPKGDWSATVTYSIGDTVVSAGTPYRCTTGNTNSVPPSGNWTAITAGASGAWKATGSAASPSFNPHLLADATLAQFPKTFLWGSSGDTVCLTSTQTYLAGKIGANASQHEVPTSPGHGLVPNFIDPATILAQIRSAAPV